MSRARKTLARKVMRANASVCLRREARRMVRREARKTPPFRVGFAEDWFFLPLYLGLEIKEKFDRRFGDVQEVRLV